MGLSWYSYANAKTYILDQLYKEIKTSKIVHCKTKSFSSYSPVIYLFANKKTAETVKK